MTVILVYIYWIVFYSLDIPPCFVIYIYKFKIMNFEIKLLNLIC